MRVVRTSAVVFAILGGIYALLAYATVARDQGGAAAAPGYVWLLVIGVFAVFGVVQVAVARPRDDDSRSDRICPGCGTPLQQGWTWCPECGTRTANKMLESSLARSENAVAEWGRPAEDSPANGGLVGKAAFWLGILVLDALFVVLALWLFVPSLKQDLSQNIFWTMFVVGMGCTLVGHSFRRWA